MQTLNNEIQEAYENYAQAATRLDAEFHELNRNLFGRIRLYMIGLIAPGFFDKTLNVIDVDNTEYFKMLARDENLRELWASK
jgi:hypothetical protein